MDVERYQLRRAIELEPDLITLVCGANDVLESTRPDAGEYARRLAGMFRRLRREAPDAEIMSATYPDISRFLDLRPRSRARVEKGMEVFNAAARKVALSHGVVLLEGFDHPAAQERSTFGDDGFHPSEEGHRGPRASSCARCASGWAGVSGGAGRGRSRAEGGAVGMTTFEKDFDALTVGERYVTRGRTIGEADITAFATLTGDTHPQHTDAEWAAGSRFGERIAHGLLVLSYASGLMPFDPSASWRCGAWATRCSSSP